jgi:hypothetical protein
VGWTELPPMEPILSCYIHPLAIAIPYFLTSRNSPCRGHVKYAALSILRRQWKPTTCKWRKVRLISIHHVFSVANVNSVVNWNCLYILYILWKVFKKSTYTGIAAPARLSGRMSRVPLDGFSRILIWKLCPWMPPQIRIFYFLWSVIATWRKHERVKWKQH